MNSVRRSSRSICMISTPEKLNSVTAAAHSNSQRILNAASPITVI